MVKVIYFLIVAFIFILFNLFYIRLKTKNERVNATLFIIDEDKDLIELRYGTVKTRYKDGVLSKYKQSYDKIDSVLIEYRFFKKVKRKLIPYYRYKKDFGKEVF